VAGVSRENGLEGWAIYKGSINTARFLEAIKEGFPDDR